MNRFRRRSSAMAWILLVAAAQACDEEDVPMGPEAEAESLRVSGVWTETAEVTLDDCDLLPESETSTRILEQDGTELVANVGGTILQGEIDPATGEFTLELRVGDAFAIQSGVFSSDTTYTAGTTATLANGCRFETVDQGIRRSVLAGREPTVAIPRFGRL